MYSRACGLPCPGRLACVIACRSVGFHRPYSSIIYCYPTSSRQAYPSPMTSSPPNQFHLQDPTFLHAFLNLTDLDPAIPLHLHPRLLPQPIHLSPLPPPPPLHHPRHRDQHIPTQTFTHQPLLLRALPNLRHHVLVPEVLNAAIQVPGVLSRNLSH